MMLVNIRFYQTFKGWKITTVIWTSVAGTSKGITALQLDIKIEGLSKEILVDALTQAKAGRFHILDKMNEVIDAPRASGTDRAPKVETIMIKPDKVGLLIGPGGKQIKRLKKTPKRLFMLLMVTRVK